MLIGILSDTHIPDAVIALRLVAATIRVIRQRDRGPEYT